MIAPGDRVINLHPGICSNDLSDGASSRNGESVMRFWLGRSLHARLEHALVIAVIDDDVLLYPNPGADHRMGNRDNGRYHDLPSTPITWVPMAWIAAVQTP